MARRATYEELEQRVKELEKEAVEGERAQDALKETQARYRDLIESAHDMIQSVGPDGSFAFVNRAWLETLGYSEEELPSLNLFDIIHPESLPNCQEVFSRIMAGQRVVAIEATFVAKDGEAVYVEGSASPRLIEGKAVATHAIFRDVSERRLDQEALRKAHLELEMRIEERTSELVEATKRLTEEIEERERTQEALEERSHQLGERVKELNCLYGISNLVEKPDISMDEILQGIVSLIPLSWQHPEIACSRIVINGQEYRSEEFKETVWKQSDDVIFYGKPIGRMEVYYLEEKAESDEGPFLKEERKLIGAIAERLGKTIERKEAQEERAKLRSQLQEAQKMEAIATLAGGMAHLFNNALTSITGHTSLLEMEYPEDEKIKKYAGAMKQSSLRMAHLTSQLLAPTSQVDIDYREASFGSSPCPPLQLMRETH